MRKDLPVFQYVQSCPKCGGEGLRAEAKIDLLISYNGTHFFYEGEGNDPVVDSYYCFECGETFTLEEVEKHAKEVINSKKDN